MSDQVKFDIIVDVEKALASLESFKDKVDSVVKAVNIDFKKLDESMDKITQNMRSMNQMKMSGMTKGLTQANKQADKLDKKMRQINSSSRGSKTGRRIGGRMMNGAMGMLGGLGAYNLIGMMTGAVGSGIKLESSMADIEGILANTKGGFEGLREEIIATGKETAFTITQMAGAAKFMAMAGQSNSSIKSTLPHAANLAMIGNMGVDRSADIMTNISAAMGIDLSKKGNASALSDAMTATTTGATVTMDELGEAIAYAGNDAATHGLSVHETLSALGILGNSKMRGSRGGTSLGMMIRRLGTQTPKGEKMMDKLGINTLSSDGKSLKPLEEIIKLFKESGAGKRELEPIFGVRGGRAMSALLSSYGDEGGYTQLLKNQMKSKNLSENLAQKKMATTSGLMAKANTSFESVGISIMDSIRPAFNFALKGFTNVFDRLSTSKRFLTGVKTTANAIAFSMNLAYFALKGVFNFVTSNYSLVVEALTAIGVVMAALAIKAVVLQLSNPFVAWTVGILAVIVALDELAKVMPTTEQMGSDFDDRKELNKKGNKKIYKSVSNMFNGYGSWDKNSRNFASGMNDWYSSFMGTKTFQEREETSFTDKENEARDERVRKRPDATNPNTHTSLSDQIFGGLKESMEGWLLPKDGFLAKMLEDLDKVKSTIDPNVTKYGTGGTEEGDTNGTLSSPLSSVANEMSRSIVVNMDNLVGEIVFNGDGNDTLSENGDKLSDRVSELLLHIVQDYELGMSN